MENADPSEKAKEEEYARSGMMMLVTIAILFVVIIVMLCLHVYLRWYLLRHRHRQQQQPRRNSRSRSRNRNRSHFIFYVDPALTTASRGLDASVIASLPVFTFSPSSGDVECAVCLSEFEVGETGRVLPKCKHSFHLECIDMWFASHSTCPLCRVHVEVSVQPVPVEPVDNNVCETEPGSNSEEVNRVEEANSNSSSSSSYCYSSASSSSSIWKCLSFKSVGEDSASGYETATSSPMMSRMMSLKRILSREKKEASSVAELDVERGGGGGGGGDSVS